jgi:diguanylate cyclase (GGDEF)-like protein/PAS domain S-box-containing protein
LLIARLQRRRQQEELSGAISSRLLGVGAAQLENEVIRALEDVGRAYGVDYSFIHLLGIDRATITYHKQWHAADVETPGQSMIGCSLAQIPWLLSELRQLKPINIPDPDDISADAVQCHHFMDTHHVRAAFVVPLAIDSELLGFCGLLHRRIHPNWDSDDVVIMKLIGETLAGRLIRAQVEERLANERSLLRSLIDNVPDTLYAKDTQGRFIAANRAAAALVHHTPQSIVGLNDFELFEPALARQYYDDDQAVMRTSAPLIERVEIVPDARGERRWYSSTKVPLRDVQGRIIGMVGIGHDITDSKRIEEALRDSEARFRALFTGMSEGVALHKVVYDEAGTPVNYAILDVNSQYETILGIRREDVIDKLATDVYGVAQAPYLSEYATVAATEQPYHFETYFAPMDRHFLISVSSLGEGRFATLFFDISERRRVEAELRTAEANYRTLYENAVMGIFQSTPSGRYLSANPAMTRIYGFDSVQEMIDFVGSDIAGRVYVDPERRNELRRVLDTVGVVNDFESEDLTRDGKPIWSRVNARTVRDTDGAPLYYEGFLEDVTERKMAEHALRESEERFRILAENSRDIIWTMDASDQMTYCSPAIRQLLGFEPAEALKGFDSAIFTPESRKEMQAVLKKESDDYADGMRDNVYHIDIQHQHKNGSLVWVDILIQRILNAQGEKVGLLGVSRDTTARKQAEEKLQYLSTHDALTGLFNRACFEEELERVDKSGAFPVSIILADIDGLKIINDRQGHAAGDQMLLGAAKVLRAVFRAKDIAARIGGDEFAVLLPVTTEAAGQAALQRLRDEISHYNTEHTDMPLSISLGVATASHWNRPDELVSLADTRMYEDKRVRPTPGRTGER